MTTHSSHPNNRATSGSGGGSSPADQVDREAAERERLDRDRAAREERAKVVTSLNGMRRVLRLPPVPNDAA